MSNFTKEEAEAKIGKKVRLTAHLPSMPKGTMGKVTMFDDLMMSIHDCTIAVEWDLEESTHRATFWFRKISMINFWRNYDEHEA